jgi:tRNA G26 N,N-dimethylase Trm1
MLSDGVISADEAGVLNAEDKRLHLSDEEVKRMIDKAKRDRELKDDISQLPLHKIAATPEHAVEHFKVLLSQIRQLGILTDANKFEPTALKDDRLTATEIALWRQIQGNPSHPS